MFAGESHVVVGTVDSDVFFDAGSECAADLFVGFLAAAGAEDVIGEVGVHAGAIPIGIAERFAVPVDPDVVFFCGAFEEVAGDPDFVTGAFSAFGEDLKFPLSGGDFGIDAFDIETSGEAEVEVFFDDFATEGIFGADGAVVGTLWGRVATDGEAKRQVGFAIPEEVFLFEAEPEVGVVIIDGCAAVGFVDGSIRVEDFAHDEEGILATWVDEDGDWFEEAVGGAAWGLVCGAAVKAPDGAFFERAAEVFDDFGFGAEHLSGFGAIQPDVLEFGFLRHFY